MTSEEWSTDFSSESGLYVDNLSLSYGEVEIFSGLTLQLPVGAVAVIRGPNGSGKSSLLRCVSGIERPSSGDVYWNGTPIRETDRRSREVIHAELGDGAYFSDLTVQEHLNLSCVIENQAESERWRGYAEQFALQLVLDRLPGSLSSGQIQRMFLAIALSKEKHLTILDEPERHLDAAGVVAVADSLGVLAERGRTAVVATHDETLLKRMAATILNIVHLNLI